MNNNSRIANNTIMLYIRTFIVMIISFFTARVTLQVLGVDNYGLNNLISGVVSMFGFLSASMGTSVQRFYTVEETKVDGVGAKKIFGSATIIHIIITVITILLTEIFAIFFLHKLNIPPDRIWVAQWIFQIAILSMALNILLVPSAAYLRAKEEFSRLAIIEIIQAFMRLGILYLLYVSPFDKLLSFSFLGLIVTLFYCGSIRLIAYRKYKDVTKPYLFYNAALFKKMLSFSILLLFSILSSSLYWQGLVMLLNLFFGLAINAAYGVSHQLKVAVDGFLLNFKQSVVPQLMSAHTSNDIKRLYKMIFFSTKITFVLAMIIAIPLLFETNIILKIWLKTPPDYTASFVRFSIILSILNSFSYFVIQVIHATGRVKGFSIISSCNSILCIAICYLFLKMDFNFYYPMYVSILMVIISIIITLYYSKKTFDFKIGLFCEKVVLKSIVYVAILTIVFLVLNIIIGESTLRLFINIILDCIISFISIYIMFDKDEKEYIFIYIRKITSRFGKNKLSR